MTIKLALSALASLAILVACAVPEPDSGDRVPVTPEGRVDQTPPTTTTHSYRPGLGIVESASVLSLSSSTSASAGGTAAAATNPTLAYRLRMIGGTTQDVVQAGEPFAVGERVRLNSEGRLVRP